MEMDKKKKEATLSALNTLLARARHDMARANVSAQGLGLKEIPEICTQIAQVIGRLADISSLQVFASKVAAPKKELKIRRFEVVDRKGLTRHGRHLNFRVRFHIKKSSSHVHVDRWLSEGRIKEVA